MVRTSQPEERPRLWGSHQHSPVLEQEEAAFPSLHLVLLISTKLPTQPSTRLRCQMATLLFATRILLAVILTHPTCMGLHTLIQ